MVDAVEKDTGEDVTADKKIRQANPDIVAKIEDIFYGITDTTDTKKGVHLYNAWCEACKTAANDSYVIEDADARQTLAEAGLLDEKGKMSKLIRTVMAATVHLDARNLKL